MRRGPGSRSPANVVLMLGKRRRDVFLCQLDYYNNHVLILPFYSVYFHPGLGLVTWRYQARILVGPNICHRGCAYAVLQTVQRPGVHSAAYVTVHYREPLESFEIRVGHSPGFGLPSVAILP